MKGAVWLLLAGACAPYAFGSLGCSSPRVVQPIAFNHKVHTETVECGGCHGTVADEARAGMPKLESCMVCHEPKTDKRPEVAKMAVFREESREVPWAQVYAVPDYVFFSHRRHVTVAKLECAVCHGDVEHRVQPFTAADPELAMSTCVRCHDHKAASVDCAACHR